MKFRIYQLYYITTVVLLIVTMCSRLGYILSSNNDIYSINCFTLTKPDLTVSYSVVALGVVLIVATVVNLFGLLVSLFSNFELQKRTSILSMLLIAGFYILYVLYAFAIIYCDENLVTYGMDEGTLFPFTALVLNFLTFLAVRKTEANILAKATGFRLRD
ncbi:MAG: DUF4293 family protein [Bacteroidaceae bacterium]|nr:DUF4293 family protein [Bacteroidaceae bacterium]